MYTLGGGPESSSSASHRRSHPCCKLFQGHTEIRIKIVVRRLYRMPVRQSLTVIAVLLSSVAILSTTACTSSKAEPERVYSAAPAPVVQVSPTPQARAESISIAAVGDI